MMISPEDFTDAVVATLRAEMPAALLAQTAAWADDDSAARRVVELPPPADGDYYPGGVATVVSYPTVEVAVPDFAASNFDIIQQDADVALTLIVRCFDRHPVQDILYRKMSRIGAAIIEVLTTLDAIGDSRIVNLRGAWRFNPETDQLDQIVSGVLIAFTVTTTLRQ